MFRSGTYYHSKNCPVFVPFGAVEWGVFDTPLRPGMCGPSKNCPVFVPFGAVCGAYAIHSYDWVCAILQNTDVIPRPGTCEGSKNGSVYATVGGVWWSVCNTPLRPGMCDPSKYRCNSPTGYVRPFKKLSRFRPLRGRLWGVFNTPLRPGTCDPMKYRYNSPTGYVLSF